MTITAAVMIPVHNMIFRVFSADANVASIFFSIASNRASKPSTFSMPLVYTKLCIDDTGVSVPVDNQPHPSIMFRLTKY